MNQIPITDTQFEAAVRLVAAWDEAELVKRRQQLKAKDARGYYVAVQARRLSLKLVIKAAYKTAGLKWNHLQSRAVFDRFKHLCDGFTLVHEPKVGVLTRTQLTEEEELETEYVKRLKRKGQAAFRSALLGLNPVCHLTGCGAVASLEAAHIMPFAAGGSDATDNGMLLRADLHRLFDLGFIAISPKSGRIWLHAACAEDYSDLLSFKLNNQQRQQWQPALLKRWSERRK
ncbi:HNH endonuclease [Sphingobium olei]|uniref:HNH endonuclease n=1 Tax=Sphingobium olei TaxID=420955 RepID=A0ABW3P1M6_9SPHN